MAGSDMNSRIAANIKALRKKQRMSLQAVATASGVSKTHVWDLERGRTRNPTISTLDAIGAALGVTLKRMLQ